MTVPQTPNFEADTPRLRQRAEAFAYYLGLAPFILLPPIPDTVTFRRRHYDAACASFFLLTLLGLLLLLLMVGLSALMVWARPLYEQGRLEPYALDALWKLLLAWGVLHVFCMAHALAGSSRKLPLLSWLGGYAFVPVTAVWSGRTFTVLLLLTALLATHAATLTRTDDLPGKVYMVYENNNFVPRWVFNLGAYRLAHAARDVYGANEMVLVRITRDTIRRAFREGEFVVVASHGQVKGRVGKLEGYGREGKTCFR